MHYDDIDASRDCTVDPDLTLDRWGEGGWTNDDITIQQGPEGTADLWITPASRPPQVATTGWLKVRFARSAAAKVGMRLIQAAGGDYPIEAAFRAGFRSAQRFDWERTEPTEPLETSEYRAWLTEAL